MRLETNGMTIPPFFFHLSFFSHTQQFPGSCNPGGMNQNTITIFYHSYEPVPPCLGFSPGFIHTYCTVHMQMHAWMKPTRLNILYTHLLSHPDGQYTQVCPPHPVFTNSLKYTHSFHIREMLVNIIDLDYDFSVCIILSLHEATTLAVCACLFVFLCPHIYTFICVYLCAFLSVYICWQPGALPCQSAEPDSYLTLTAR